MLQILNKTAFNKNIRTIKCTKFDKILFRQFKPKQPNSFRKKINSIGVIFVWDIRPDKKTIVILRTCLRYNLNLSLDIPKTNKQLHFDMWE